MGRRSWTLSRPALHSKGFSECGGNSGVRFKIGGPIRKREQLYPKDFLAIRCVLDVTVILGKERVHFLKRSSDKGIPILQKARFLTGNNNTSQKPRMGWNNSVVGMPRIL